MVYKSGQIFLPTVLSQYTRVTDGQTDGPTDGQTDRQTDRQNSHHNTASALHAAVKIWPDLSSVLSQCMCLTGKHTDIMEGSMEKCKIRR